MYNYLHKDSANTTLYLNIDKTAANHQYIHR
jgi:hypothetical protein